MFGLRRCQGQITHGDTLGPAPMALTALAPQVLQAAAALETANRACRANLTKFVLEVARNEEGEAITLAPMHLQWHRHLDYCWSNGLRCMILAHFGSGKSSSFAVPLISWLVGNDVQRRIKVVSNSDAQAKQRVASVKQLMESVAYRKVFPEVRPGAKWSDHELFVRRQGYSLDPSVHARGVFTIGVGGRADVIVFDDVVDQKNSEDPTQRRKVRNMVDQTWLTRLDRKPGVPEPLVLWIATPWHVDDATHGLMATPGWCTLTQSCSVDCTEFRQEVSGALIGVPYPDGDRWATPTLGGL